MGAAYRCNSIPTVFLDKLENLVRPLSRLLGTGAAVSALVLVAACSSSSSSSSGSDVTLKLVAYSTPQPAYTALIAAFQKTSAGKHVKFSQSYGASGDQASAVLSGEAADIVEFSLQTDMTKLVKKNLVAANWNVNQYKGFVTDSVVSFVVRKGNPKHIENWSDLVKPGLKVLTPNPFSSGSARWNILGAYGAAIKQGDTQAQATQYLTQLLHNVPVQDASGAKALTDFISGEGDVLISYENEAIYAQEKKEPVDYVTPSDTLLIQNPIAVTKNSAHPTQAQAFLSFLYSKQGQQIFADTGYRPVVSGIKSKNSFPTPSGLFTITDLGGWTAATTKFFDPASGIITKVEKSLGVSTSK